MAEAVRKLQLTGHGYKQAGSATLDIFFCLVQEQFNKEAVHAAIKLQLCISPRTSSGGTRPILPSMTKVRDMLY